MQGCSGERARLLRLGWPPVSERVVITADRGGVLGAFGLLFFVLSWEVLTKVNSVAYGLQC